MAISEADLYRGLRGLGDPRYGEFRGQPDRHIIAGRDLVAVALLAGMEERVSELWQRRRWYRNHVGWIVGQQVEDRAELRYLVGRLREARRIANRVERAAARRAV